MKTVLDLFCDDSSDHLGKGPGMHCGNCQVRRQRSEHSDLTPVNVKCSR